MDIIKQHKEHLKEGAKIWADNVNQIVVDELYIIAMATGKTKND